MHGVPQCGSTWNSTKDAWWGPCTTMTRQGLVRRHGRKSLGRGRPAIRRQPWRTPSRMGAGTIVSRSAAPSSPSVCSNFAGTGCADACTVIHGTSCRIRIDVIAKRIAGVTPLCIAEPFTQYHHLRTRALRRNVKRFRLSVQALGVPAPRRASLGKKPK
jgi:hypothetical protein